MDGDAALADMIARLRRLGSEGLELAAREARPLVEAAAKATAAAGTDPYGNPWPLRKDGQRAIPDAAAAVDVVVRGPNLIIQAHRGAAVQNSLAGTRYGRQVIPDAARGLPPGMSAALREGASRALRRLVA